MSREIAEGLFFLILLVGAMAGFFSMALFVEWVIERWRDARRWPSSRWPEQRGRRGRGRKRGRD